MASTSSQQVPIVMVIDFHHARGPEIEHCIGNEGTDPAVQNDWSLLPFMALSDGAHMSTEEFSYFTLHQKETAAEPATSLFGIACARQIDASILKYKPPEVTRSTVQKAVVVVTDSPQYLGQLREKLSVVTSAWFAQRDFSDIDILKKFREGLVISLEKNEGFKDQNLGLSLREMIHEFKYQTLVLFKALLLQPKMLFFGSRCERLCMIQFSLVSLIPGLMNSLGDCADPSFDNYAQTVQKPTSLKTSDRSSLLSYMGLPLQIFGKGSMFGPYTPLQQLDLLADDGTKSYVVGSTNSLLLQQKDRYSDILINLDEDTINISSPTLRNALALSTADRRWIDLLTQIINETWDESHPERPRTHGYMGSEEFIRLQFEEYLLALLACMKYHEELHSFNAGGPGRRTQEQIDGLNIEGDPALEFNGEFLAMWQNTSNYALFSRLTSDALPFSIVEPRHPCAGGLTIDDVQRRISQQVADLHLDDRVREGREALNRHLSTGQKKMSAAFNSFWSDIESMREAQKKRNEEKAMQSQRQSLDGESSPQPPPLPRSNSAAASTTAGSNWMGRKAPPLDITQAQASVNTVGQKAGAYFSSWSSWAADKRKEWQEKKSSSPSSPSSVTSPSTPILATVAETTDAERGRRKSLQARRDSSGSLSSVSLSLSRSGSRRKRWSNILLRRESGEFSSLHRKDDGSGGDSSDYEPIYPRSPLSREAPVLGEDIKEPEGSGTDHADKASTDAHDNTQGSKETKASPSSPIADKEIHTTKTPQDNAKEEQHDDHPQQPTNEEKPPLPSETASLPMTN
ncbi:transport protein Avl9-domain-containing protein [Aspergillus taichungensis]|uniref:Transport protein Avl9-domain-containing protein n=1 Tax=Aspergillus taichungensis TaxID=482145 RepID=A0A2J5HKH3_9EURO|nr:transport protein Avl9-domain-containing protein [Aspergillus taichungensis]